MRDAEIVRNYLASVVGTLVLISASAAGACHADTKQSATRAEIPTERPIHAAVTFPVLTPADRVIIAAVKAKLSPAARPCVAYVRAFPGIAGFSELPDHGLAVIFDERGERDAMAADRAHFLLYFDGAIHVKSNTMFWTATNEYVQHASSLTDLTNARCQRPQPTDLSRADQAIVDRVKSEVPPAAREHVAWFRVSPGELGYDLLPDHGLVVVYDKGGEQDALDGNGPVYVLYYAGDVHVDSNVVYDPAGDRYLAGIVAPINYEDPHPNEPSMPRIAGLIPPRPSPSVPPSGPAIPPPWQSDESALDAAGRAIVAQVRAKMPAEFRRCIVWARLPSTFKNDPALPDHNLVVMIHFRDEGASSWKSGYYVLYIDGAVHLDSNVVYIPNYDDEPILVTPMSFNRSWLTKDAAANCLT